MNEETREGKMHPHLKSARARLLELVREKAYVGGLRITLSSGKTSDYYVDGKKITLDPEGLHLFAKLLLAELESYPEVTAVGGMSIGADPIAAAVCALSHEGPRPIRAFLVRKEPKGHGTGSLVEGELEPGDKVAVVEDTITTGGSSEKVCRILEDMGVEIAVVLALVDREDPDGDSFRRRRNVVPIFRISEIRDRKGTED